MEFNELTAGKKVYIEFAYGVKVISFEGLAMGNVENSVLVMPLFDAYSGEAALAVNLKSVVCSVFTVDENDERIGWNNVAVRMMKYKDKIYYGLETNNFNKYSIKNERRGHERYPVGVVGDLAVVGREETVPVVVHDISDNGISFLALGDLGINGIKCILYFQDTISDTEYKLKVFGRCVRVANPGREDGKILYGCKMDDPDRKVLNYVFDKRLIEKQKQKESEAASGDKK